MQDRATTRTRSLSRSSAGPTGLPQEKVDSLNAFVSLVFRWTPQTFCGASTNTAADRFNGVRAAGAPLSRRTTTTRTRSCCQRRSRTIFTHGTPSPADGEEHYCSGSRPDVSLATTLRATRARSCPTAAPRLPTRRQAPNCCDASRSEPGISAADMSHSEPPIRWVRIGSLDSATLEPGGQAEVRGDRLAHLWEESAGRHRDWAARPLAKRGQLGRRTSPRGGRGQPLSRQTRALGARLQVRPLTTLTPSPWSTTRTAFRRRSTTRTVGRCPEGTVDACDSGGRLGHAQAAETQDVRRRGTTTVARSARRGRGRPREHCHREGPRGTPDPVRHRHQKDPRGIPDLRLHRHREEHLVGGRRRSSRSRSSGLEEPQQFRGAAP